MLTAAPSPLVRPPAHVRAPAPSLARPQDLGALIAKLLKTDEKLVTLYSFSSLFGGGRSTGFGLIYDSVDAMKKFEPKYRLKRAGIDDGKKKRSRKQWKDQKKKVRGACAAGATRAHARAGAQEAARPRALRGERRARSGGWAHASRRAAAARSRSVLARRPRPPSRLPPQIKRTWGTGKRETARAAKKAAAS